MSLLADASAPARVVLDDEPRDRMARGPDRQRVAWEPARVLQLLLIDGDLAAGVLGDEADHELAGEGPVLAPDVLDVLHVHADFFLYLAGDGAFQRLAVVDEAGDQRVAAGRPDGFAGQQHGLAAPRAEQQRLLGRYLEARGGVAERQGQLVVVVGDDQALVLDDEPVAAAVGQRAAPLGRFERLADAVAIERQGRG